MKSELHMLLTPEGADYLRNMAESMRMANESIAYDTFCLNSIFENYFDTLGTNVETFQSIVNSISSVSSKFDEDSSFLCAKLYKVADLIDAGPGGHRPPVKQLKL